jgi:DNA repair protein RadC
MKEAIYKQKLMMKKVDMPLMQNIYTISTGYEAREAALYFWDLDEIHITESFYAVYLSKTNEVIAIAEIGRGGIDAVTVDRRIIFAHAILCAASGIILYHNHPSGQLRPSQQDIFVTEDIKKVGKMMNINVLDHIILSPSFAYYSFAEEGRI